jgi:carboxylesterase
MSADRSRGGDGDGSSAPLLTGAEPFSADGGRTGVLVLHGFTGSPQSMRPWAQYLAGAGFTVRLPLLPGHGTSVADMARTGWMDWYGAASATFDELRQRCDEVFVMGLSMGATLALRLAELRPDVAGLVVVNASVISQDRRLMLLPVLQHVVPSLPGIGSDIKRAGVTELAYDRVPLRALASLRKAWGEVRRDLSRITCPVLHYRSRTDHVVEPRSGELMRSGIRNLHEVVLEESYHVATLDNDATTVFTGSVDFLRQYSRSTAG